MLPSVSVPVLSVQITSVEPSVSTAVRRLTSARRAAIRRTPPASERVIVGKSPSGTLATSKPIANVTAAASDRPASVMPATKNMRPGRDRDRRDQPRDAVDLALQRADLGLHALRQRRDPAQLRGHPGRVDDRLGLHRPCTACPRTRDLPPPASTWRAARRRRCAPPALTRRSTAPCSSRPSPR